MKKILLITIALLLATLMFADVIIGTSTANNQYYPMSSWNAVSRTAAIYLQSEIGAGITIDRLAWQVQTATTVSTPTKIYVKHTTDATLTAQNWASLTTGLTPVFDGTTVASPTGWFEVNISDFAYNGTDNLLVLVETNRTAYASPYAKFYYTSTSTDYRTLLYGNDTAPYAGANLSTSYLRPNIKLVTPVTTPPNAAVIGAPANAASLVLPTATLSWASGGGAPTGYKLYFGTDGAGTSTPTNIVNGTDLGNVLSYDPNPDLTAGTTYYWKVVPYNGIGDATTCPIWSFTTMGEGYTQIGTGTSTQIKPFGTTWGYERSAALYTAAQVGSIGTLDEIAWYCVGTSATAIPYKIYVKSTTDAAMTAMTWPSFVASAQLVKEGTYSFSSSGWKLFELDSPFPYISGNLIIGVETNYGGGGGGSGHTFYYSTGTTGSHQYWNTDNSPSTANGTLNTSLPNVLLHLGELSDTPELAVSPTSWDFGQNFLNIAATKQFTISNIGGGTLNLSSVVASGSYYSITVAPTDMALTTGESTTFTVQYLPTAVGASHTGTVTITDGRAVTTINLSGSCVDPTIYHADLPHVENFDAVTVPALPFGWTSINVNADAVNWGSYATSPYSAPNCASIGYNSSLALNDWMISPPLSLVGGTTYRLGFHYRAGSTSWTEKMKVMLGTGNQVADMTTQVFINESINFSEYASANPTFTVPTTGIYYLGWHAYSIANQMRIYVDDITISIPAPEPPLPATVSYPLNGNTALLNPMLKWTPSASGEPASSFKVYMNQGGAFTESDLVYEGADLQYQTTGLTYGQTYYWKVLPTNTFGSDPTCPTWTFNTPGTDQLAEGFEGSTFPPIGWQRTTTNTSYWGSSTTAPFHGAKSMYAYTSTSTLYTVSTPLLTVGASSTLDFYAKATATSQVLQVMQSTDRANWTQVGTDITFAAINEWYPISINLGGLTPGDYYLAFHSPAQTVGSYYIYVDHVIGPNITPVRPDAPTLSAPSDAAPNQSPNPKLTWTAATTGGIPTGYNIYLDTNAEPTTLIGTSTTTSYDVNTALNWGDTYYWKVEATNAAGTSNASTVRSFTVMSDPTINDLPYMVDFGTVSGDWPVQNWTQLGGFYPTTTGTSSQWVRGNWLNGATGNNAAKINIWGTDRNGWLITPPIAIPADGHELRFDLGLTKWNNSIPIEDNTAQEDDRFMVLVSDSANMSNATILQEWNNSGSEYVFNSIPHTGTSVIIDLTGHTGAKYFAFYGESTITGNGDNDLFVDNVMVRETPIGRPDPVTLVSPADEATYLPVEGFTLNWTPAITGGTPSSYKVYLDTNPDPSTLIATETEPSHEIVTPLAYGSTYYWKVIAHNSSGDADASTIFSFETVPEGLVVLGDGTANNSLPVNALYGYTYSQTIYPQASINLDTKRIEKISYYWNGAGVGTNTGGWTVYMGHTSATEFASTTDWIPLTELTQVFTGNVPIPATAGWIEIPLHTPFIYNNIDNLVIAVDENTSGYDASGRYFYTTGTGTNSVSIRYQNDSTNPDPATPPTGTLVSAYPNIRMQLGDIPTGPPDHVTLLSPENDVTGVLPEDVVLSWASSLSGGIATYYEIYVGEDPIDPGNDYYGEYLYESTGTNFDLSAQTDIDLGYSSRWYWAVLPFNAGSESPDPTDPEFMVWNFTTIEDPAIVSLPYEENFDDVTAPALPYGWTGYIGSTNTSAYVRTTTSYPVSQPNSVYLTNSSDATADLRLITPDITVPMNSIKLSFSARGGSTGYNLRVGTVDALDETGTFTQLASIDLTASHETYSVSFAGYAGTDQNICFKHGLGGTYRSIYIDDVAMDELVPNDLAVVSLTGRDYGFQNTDVTHTVTVKNNGTSTQNSYTVYLKSVDNRIVLASETINEELLPDATKAIELTWAPSALGALEIYGEVVLAGDVVPVNNVSDIMAFTTHQEGILVEGFEGGVIPSNWTVINADGGVNSWVASTTYPRTGSYSARIGYETSSLDNDDWLITPPLQVTSETTDNISFWLRSYSASYDDPWQVLISTTDTNPASFTMIDSGPGSLGAYVEKSYNLDSYGDAVVYLAVRYMGSFDWYLYVDDFVGPPIYVAPFPPSAVTMDYPAADATMQPRTGFNFAWTPGEPGASDGVPTSYSFYLATSAASIQNEFSADDLTATAYNPVGKPYGAGTFSFDTWGQRWYWQVEAHNEYGSTLSEIRWFEIQPDPTITTFPWSDGFEAYDDFATTFAPWTGVDVDGSITYGFDGTTFPGMGDPMSYIVFNPATTDPAIASDAAIPHGGDKFAACFAAIKPADGGNGPNNDWLITPPIVVQDGLEFSFWAKTYMDYGLENFNVAVSTTGMAPEDFTVISGTTPLEAPLDWTQYSYPLSAYNGSTIYVAIQCVSDDVFIFMVDDVLLKIAPTELDAPVVSIAADGTLSWAPVSGAASYIITKSTIPEGPFTYATTVLAPQSSWLDPTFGADKMFYQVTASTDAPAKNVAIRNNSTEIPSDPRAHKALKKPAAFKK